MSKAAHNVNRRPSVEIARDYVELDFKAVIDADRLKSMTPEERKAAELAAKRAARKRLNPKCWRALRIALCAIVVLVMVCGTVTTWWNVSTSAADAKDITVRQFVVDKGSSSMSVATALQRAGFIRNAIAFCIYVKLYGGNVQAGTHMLSPSFTLAKIAQTLASSTGTEINIQIPPGLTLDKLKDNFKKYDYTEQDVTAAFSKKYDNPILADLPKIASLEGYLYPDTYRVRAGDKLDVVINKALNQFYKVAKSNGILEGFKKHGLNIHKGITLASIVTKEVKSPSDQKKVAGVFYNRLIQGYNLGSDVTFKYAYAQGLCNTNSPKCDSAYNTRINKGLPPGPIANPSLSALKAVANPDSMTAMYFVAGDDGKTYFSDTLDQHNKAIAAHCTELCK